MPISPKSLSFSIVLALWPLCASAINCEFGCKGTACHTTVTAAAIVGSAPMQYQFGRAFALPPLGGVSNSPLPVVNDICDQIVTGSSSGTLMAYAERPISSLDARRHRVEFDLTGVRAEIHSGTGARSWWHGMVTWIIPMPHTPWGSDLRVDYSGGFVFPWEHYQPKLRLMLDHELLAEVGLETTQIAIELRWGNADPVSVVIAEFAGTPPNRRGTPSRLTEIEVPDTEAQGLKPAYLMVGRSASGTELRSTGVLSAASYLVLPPPPQ